MIVGNGLVAREFSRWKDLENIIIFASGVSNSKETRTREFKREFDLVRRFSNTENLFVYFGTCSIYDSYMSKSRYIVHKLEIEEYIKLTFKRYLILRFPNLVGRSDNPNTFFNFFYNSITNGTKINVEKNSTRYFLDVETIEPIVHILVNVLTIENKIINIAINNRAYIPEVLHMMEELMKKKANVNILEKGNSYCIPNDQLMSFQNEFLDIKYLFDHNQTLKCFQKYIEEKQNTIE